MKMTTIPLQKRNTSYPSRYGRLYPSPEDAIRGRTVCCVRYYMHIEEFDWWNVEPFCCEKPFYDW
ncbi:MAG: hypothetical protein MOIL_00195 [Candidatus Methanolliviera sp. GoM_oil]|nr:MAG: hypothetical protein MOIL_00195 [Candidatus Methanolliviera sp. GoM_oil]